MSQREALRQAVEVSPDNVPLLLLYAAACLEDYAPEDARRAFERVLAVDPEHIEAQIGIARVLFFTGKASEAAVRLEAALAKDPRHHRGLQLYARVLLHEGNHEQAREYYARSLAVPGATPDPELDRELGRVDDEDEHDEPKRVALTPQGEARGDDDDDFEPQASMLEVERPKTGFDDVGGMETVKQEFRMKVLYPMRNPDLFRAYGKKIGGGVLLYGPPGCGKTLLARACAGEMDSTFMAIGIHQVLDMWLGSSEKLLHEIFTLARRHAPCILFFDEVDALAADRVQMRHSAGRTLINQFLAELDGGSDASNEGVLVIGATNAPWHVDGAFLRPGRFDRVLFVPPPDEPARAAIVEIQARSRPVATLDAKAVARKTRDYSGADLKNLFDVATERCLEKAMQEGRVVPLTTDILLRATTELRPTTKAWFESARNYALYANQSGLYDEVLTYLGIKK